MSRANHRIGIGSARPTAWSFVLCLTVLIGPFFLLGDLVGQDRLDQEPMPQAFSRDLSAHRMLSGFAEQGAAINHDVSAAYEARLVRHFPVDSALD